MYGSMASDMAIDSSDVDLSVIGLNFNGNKDLMIKEMRTFYEQFQILEQKSSINQIKFIK